VTGHASAPLIATVTVTGRITIGEDLLIDEAESGRLTVVVTSHLPDVTGHLLTDVAMTGLRHLEDEVGPPIEDVVDRHIIDAVDPPIADAVDPPIAGAVDRPIGGPRLVGKICVVALPVRVVALPVRVVVVLVGPSHEANLPKEEEEVRSCEAHLVKVVTAKLTRPDRNRLVNATIHPLLLLKRSPLPARQVARRATRHHDRSIEMSISRHALWSHSLV